MVNNDEMLKNPSFGFWIALQGINNFASFFAVKTRNLMSTKPVCYYELNEGTYRMIVFFYVYYSHWISNICIPQHSSSTYEILFSSCLINSPVQLIKID